MVGYFERSRVLVMVDLSRPGYANLEPTDLLSSTEVVLLGLYPVADQLALEQARTSFEAEAQDNLDTLQERFQQVGVEVEPELVFTHDPQASLDQVACQKECDALLTWNEQRTFDQVGVFLRYQKEWESIIDSVASLMVDEDSDVELVTFYEDDQEDRNYEELKTTLDVQKDYLVDRGVDADQISTCIDEVEDGWQAVIDRADEYDAVVMGEPDPSLMDNIFGTLHEDVDEATDGPVLIVRHPDAKVGA